MQKRTIYTVSCFFFCLASLGLLFLPSPPLCSFAENGFTLAAGLGWRNIWYDMALSPAGEIWGTGSAGIFKKLETEEFGWEKLSTAENSYFYSIKIDTGTIWACGDKGLVIFSTDAGKSWREKSLGDFALFEIEILDSSGAIVVGERGKIFITGDGENWSEYSLAEDLNLEDVEFIDSKTGWMVGEEGAIWQTTDGGESWTRQRQVLTKADLHSVKFLSQYEGWIVGLGGTILHTQDGGAIWEKISSPISSNLFSADFQGDMGIIVGARGTILLSRDRGTTWETVTLETARNTDLTTVQLIAASASVSALLAGSHSFSQEWKIPERKPKLSREELQF